ncbi:hypothetical protein ACQ4M3_29295 [Leptolyngbya sp. AN03gr2]|uniref:hypothetical protein n=1 Tax=unclassified Leptolyngbya TaxID=2650499 RepID=UPI003D31EEB2
MRQEVKDRLRSLIKQRAVEGWKDGWIYGQLKQEFKLSDEELNSLSSILGFKYGWNSLVEEVLEKQWQEEEKAWKKKQQIRNQQQSRTSFSGIPSDVLVTRKMLVLQQELKASGASITDVEELLITMILRMNATEQVRLLEILCKRPFPETF